VLARSMFAVRFPPKPKKEYNKLIPKRLIGVIEKATMFNKKKENIYEVTLFTQTTMPQMSV